MPRLLHTRSTCFSQSPGLRYSKDHIHPSRTWHLHVDLSQNAAAQCHPHLASKEGLCPLIPCPPNLCWNHLKIPSIATQRPKPSSTKLVAMPAEGCEWQAACTGVRVRGALLPSSHQSGCFTSKFSMKCTPLQALLSQRQAARKTVSDFPRLAIHSITLSLSYCPRNWG